MTTDMTAQDFAAGLLVDAKHQAMLIEEETREEVGRLRDETSKLLEQERQRVLAQTKRLQADLDARADARRQRHCAHAILSAKQEIIDETFAAAEHALNTLHASKRRALLKRLLERAKREIPVGSVIIAKRDATATRGMRTTAVEGIGGFIAVSKDRKLRVDMRFESLLADVKERKAEEIASILFEPTTKRKQTKKLKRAPIVKRKRAAGKTVKTAVKRRRHR
jgi:vacuolar-type H+-ATPase subunit E/Vma4